MAPLQVATAYYEAWAGKDLDRAMTYIADDIVCDAPAGRIEGAAAYRAFMAPFVQMLLATQLLAAFGDDEHAVVVYDTRTTLVDSGPAAEYVTVRNGQITYSRFIFDRLPFAARPPGPRRRSTVPEHVMPPARPLLASTNGVRASDRLPSLHSPMAAMGRARYTGPDPATLNDQTSSQTQRSWVNVVNV